MKQRNQVITDINICKTKELSHFVHFFAHFFRCLSAFERRQLHTFSYEQHIYKQREAEISKKSSKC